ncbi:hypothetical protein M8C21_009453, partial [Ambrosia artemisiifolia]
REKHRNERDRERDHGGVNTRGSSDGGGSTGDLCNDYRVTDQRPMRMVDSARLWSCGSFLIVLFGVISSLYPLSIWICVRQELQLKMVTLTKVMPVRHKNSGKRPDPFRCTTHGILEASSFSAGENCKMGMEQESEWNAAQSIKISQDLVAAAKLQLLFLAAVDRNRWLL